MTFNQLLYVIYNTLYCPVWYTWDKLIGIMYKLFNMIYSKYVILKMLFHYLPHIFGKEYYHHKFLWCLIYCHVKCIPFGAYTKYIVYHKQRISILKGITIRHLMQGNNQLTTLSVMWNWLNDNFCILAFILCMIQYMSIILLMCCGKDSTYITLTSLWPQWRLKSPAWLLFTQSFIQALIKENIKAPRHWPLCGEFTGTSEFPAQRASNAENVSIWWRHHEQFS